MRNFLRAAIILFAVLLFVPSAQAEVNTYTGEGEYVMSDFETFDIAQQRAKARAERDAQEKAGVYVESRTEVVNMLVAKDEIVVMTGGIMKIVDTKYRREILDDNTTLIRATVTAQIDDADINRWLNKDAGERETLLEQNAALQKAMAEQERQIAELRKQLAEVKTPQDKAQVAQAFAAEDKVFLSNQKVEEAWKLYQQGDYNGAARLFDAALQLNPNNALACYGRGTAYNGLEQHALAIADFTTAIELSPNNYAAYYNRGNAYRNMGQYERASADYTRAIELKPDYAEAYNNRGIACANLGRYESAIRDFNKAVELNPQNALAHYNRGVAYQKLGDFAKAQADFARARQLDRKG